ncbi:MAG TPA: spore coat protein CotJB [Lachnospiraceae bacterium]|nr:spore coat protein CotJB [Lachnospiraceae bacterium]
MMKYSGNEQQEMIHEISIVDFVLVEMTLYLDTHPMESEAIDYFNHYCKIKNKLLKEFAAKFYPLTLSTADVYSKEWKWALAPLPWEGWAN